MKYVSNYWGVVAQFSFFDFGLRKWHAADATFRATSKLIKELGVRAIILEVFGKTEFDVPKIVCSYLILLVVYKISTIRTNPVNFG